MSILPALQLICDADTPVIAPVSSIEHAATNYITLVKMF